MSKDHPDVVCRNCKWYDEKAAHIKGKGKCRINPPAAFPTAKRGNGATCYYTYEEGVWPIVLGEEDWCGSYRMA